MSRELVIEYINSSLKDHNFSIGEIMISTYNSCWVRISHRIRPVIFDLYFDLAWKSKIFIFYKGAPKSGKYQISLNNPNFETELVEALNEIVGS